MGFLSLSGDRITASKSRLVNAGSAFTPRSITGLALWLDASSPETLYTTDAGAVTAVSAPTEIAGCALWLDGADSSAASMTLNGSLVETWKDKSGNSRNATSSGSSRPTFSASGLNGKSVLTFDGTDDSMLTPDFTVSQPHTIFVVGRRAVGGANQNFVDGGTAGRAAVYWANTDNWGMFAGSGAIGPTGTDTNWHIFGATFNAASSSLRLDGAIISTTNPGTNSYTGLRIGGFNATTALLNGSIAEIIAFNTALSTTDRARVEAYLAAKWGISGVHAPATATSDPVGAWLDKSGNARHATQSTAGSRPTISATNQGGRKALAFASQSQTVVSPATVAQYVADATTSPKMFFAWVARPEGGAASVVFGSPTHPNAASRVFYASDFGAAGNHIVDFGSVSTARLTGTVGNEANNVGHVYSAFRDGAVMSVRRDGVEILRKTDTTGGYTNTTGTLSINTVSGGSATASWMEFMAYAASMPAASIARLERYLAAKWAITLAPQVSNADAQNWIDRVYANGGTVSASTAAAVNTFCDAIDSAGIRDRFYRLSLMCGGTSGTAAGLNAALVPLYRGPSLGGTQYGNTTDTNVGPFVSVDYAETGAGGGLTGNGTSKYLNTGFPTNTLADGNRHLAAYAATWPNAAYNAMLGSESTAGISSQFTLGHSVAADKNSFGCFSNTSRIQSSVISGGAFWIGINDAAGSGKLYRNGSQDGSAVLSASTPTASNVFVFAINRASSSSVTDLFNGRLSGYSIGLSMTDPQAAAYHTAMQAFQTALTRNV